MIPSSRIDKVGFKSLSDAQMHADWISRPQFVVQIAAIYAGASHDFLDADDKGRSWLSMRYRSPSTIFGKISSE